MSTLAEMLRDTTTLEASESEWLHLLVGDWQLLADLAFGDLMMWVRGDAGWQVAAHVRPTTGVSLFADDLVGARPQELDSSQTQDDADRGGDRHQGGREQQNLDDMLAVPRP